MEQQTKAIYEYEPIAVIGYGCTYAGKAENNEALWKMLIQGDTGIHEIPKERIKWDSYFSEDPLKEDKTYTYLQGCCIGQADLDQKYRNTFETAGLNRMELLSLNTVLSAFEKTQYDVTKLQHQKIGYIMGNMLGDDLFCDFSLQLHMKEIVSYIESCEEFQKVDYETRKRIITKLFNLGRKKFGSPDKDYPQKYLNSASAYEIKKILGLKGPSMIVDGACSSGILAIDESIKMLHTRELVACIVTGAMGNMNVTGSIGFSKLGALSDEMARPLDKEAKGLNSAEGFGTVILKPLNFAVRDNDKIYGVITGTGVCNDGHGKSIYAPNRIGQVKCMRKALQKARISPEQIDYIELHATGTPVGDGEEIETLKLLYSDCSAEKQSVAIGSIKPLLGHSFSAAGMAGVVKIMECFEHKMIPPTWGYEMSKEEWDLSNTPFYVNTELKEWDQKHGHRRAMVNAFGFGGTDASLVLEEYVPDQVGWHEMNRGNECREKPYNIAIVGIGVMNPNVSSKEEWFGKGKDQILVRSEYPEKRFPKGYADIYSPYIKEGGFIETISFPFLKFRIPPKVLAHIDRSQQIALMTADEAIEDYGKKRMQGAKVSVYVGKVMNTELASNFNTGIRYIEVLELLEQITEFQKLDDIRKERIATYVKEQIRKYVPPMTEDSLPGYMDNIVAGRISNYYDFDGNSVVFDAWTNSFAVALKQAIENLMENESDITIVGGIHANMTPEFFDILKSLAHDTEQQTPSEGSVFLVLKKMENVTPEDHVYARVMGIIDQTLSDFKVENVKELPESISENHKKRVHYFGADLGFHILQAIEMLNQENEDSSKWIKIHERGWMSNSYTVYMAGKENGGRRIEYG
jgi:acyl transferase domain-containing protein